MTMTFEGRLSVRLGGALHLATEFARCTAKYSKGGFHPNYGYVPETRRLSPREARTHQAALQFLLEGFSVQFTEITTAVDAREFCQWTAAANNFVNFFLAATHGYNDDVEQEPLGAYDAEQPPRIEPRVMTELEQETYDAALNFITQGWRVTVADELLVEMSSMFKDHDDEEPNAL